MANPAAEATVTLATEQPQVNWVGIVEVRRSRRYHDGFYYPLAQGPGRLTSPSFTNVLIGSADFTVNVDTANGELYVVASTSSTQPLGSAIINGSGGSIVSAATRTITVTGQHVMTLSGLTASTSYFFHAVHVNASGWRSSIVTSAQFTTSAGAGSLPIGTLTQVVETPEQLTLLANITGTISSSTVARLDYRLTGSSTWIPAHPLYHSPGDYFAGIIVDLVPGRTYDVRVSYDDGSSVDVRASGDGATNGHGTFTTRGLPSLAGPANKPATTANAQTVLNGANPGDVIELAAGTYPAALAITRSGTQASPIYVRGVDIDTVIVPGSCDIDASWIVWENMTIDGGARPIRINVSNGVADNNVIRDIKVINSDRCIAVAGGGGTDNPLINNTLIYNVHGTGVVIWDKANTFESSQYWSNDGLRIAGSGNCAWNCTLIGYGDTICLAHSDSGDHEFIYGNFAYRNYIRKSADDTIEMDHAKYLCGFYDNYCENVRQGWSQSDQGSSGPMYVFRNVFVNIGNRPFKLNSSWEGWHVYSNTFLRADSPDDPLSGSGNPDFQRGWFIWDGSNTPDQNRFAIRNNLFIYRGAKEGNSSNGPRGFWRVDWGSVDFVDHSHNAHHPDLTIFWSNFAGSYADLAAAIAGQKTIPAPTYHSRAGLNPTTFLYDSTHKLSGSNPFSSNPVMGADALTEVTGMTIPALASGSTPKNAGVHLPNITTGFSGSAPDMGAIIEGRPVPNYGFHQPTADTSLQAEISTLSAGEFRVWTPGENPQGWNGAEISWCSMIAFYDENRHEIQIATKPQENQTTSSSHHSHYIFREVDGAWDLITHTIPGTAQQGHIWQAAFDYDRGDYFFQSSSTTSVYWFRRATQVWSTLPSKTGTPLRGTSTGGSWGGLAYHPNFLGSGRGCVVAFGIGKPGYIFYCERLSETSWGSWQEHATRVDTAPNGQAIYIPADDSIVWGGGEHLTGDGGGPEQLRRIGAGSGGSPSSTITALGTAPLEPGGGSGTDTYSKMCVDPNNSSRLLLIEENINAVNGGQAANRVWASSNFGDSWSQVGTHQFHNLLNGSQFSGFTICAIPPIGSNPGVVVGMNSRPAGVWRWINWRPNI